MAIKRKTLRKLQVFGKIQDRDERSCRPGLSYVDGLLLLQDPYREICIPPLKELSLSPHDTFQGPIFSVPGTVAGIGYSVRVLVEQSLSKSLQFVGGFIRIPFL